jgi:uncharacterized protein (DUF736 family)
MSDYVQKEGTGTLFKNDKTSENQPDYKGKCLVDGKNKSISAWLNTSKDGKTRYLALKLQDPYISPDNGATKVTKMAQQDDDLPF